MASVCFIISPPLLLKDCDIGFNGWSQTPTRKQNVVTEMINFAYQTPQDPPDKGPVMLWQFMCMAPASHWVPTTLSIHFYLLHLLWDALISSEMFLVYLVAAGFLVLVPCLTRL